MALQVLEEDQESLATWAEIPIRFVVRARSVVARPIDGAGGIALLEEPVDPPYEYDYDLFEPPTAWRSWDLRHWGFLAALDGVTRVGRAAIAFRDPGLGMLEGRADLACLWDIRVRPENRGRGVGALLFETAKSWARKRGAREMKVETQDINVPACRFYAKQGCRLEAANPGIYERHPLQVQLIWTTHLY